jgi:hypothetical protein
MVERRVNFYVLFLYEHRGTDKVEKKIKVLSGNGDGPATYPRARFATSLHPDH